MIKGLIALIRTARHPALWGLAILVLTLFAIGTVFYTVVEGWSVLNSLWFSVMTLLTVGYGDLIPSTAASKIFTMFYVLLGAGILVGFIPIFAREVMDLPTRKDPGSET